LPHLLCDVEGDVERALVVLRPSGVKEVLAYLCTVNEEVELSQSGDIRFGASNGLLHVDLLTEARQLVHARLLIVWEGFVQVFLAQSMEPVDEHFSFFIFLKSNPTCSRPVALGEQSRVEPLRRAVG
jgi:hypothetical protein